jgi:hypothetical protein
MTDKSALYLKIASLMAVTTSATFGALVGAYHLLF